jgi:putative spermidine/putrescine transport system ATP-binding protein
MARLVLGHSDAERTMSQPQRLTLEDVVHRYAGSTAVDRVSLDIEPGELVALLGPSGCGKTTLLRIIAGFIAQTSGRVVIGDRCVDALAPRQREVGIVFQNYALFPHLTVADNVAYGLAARGVVRSAQRARTAEMLELVQMAALAERLPRELSGGQQQRVALARALAVQPRILLLDEPFAALDKNLRLDMQIEIKRIQRAAGITAIIVTHDQEEALSMADRVAVLNRGRLEQFDTPSAVYDRPATLFVNRFVGSVNAVSGTLRSIDGARASVELAGGLRLEARAPSVPIAVGAEVVACVRPENLRIVEADAGFDGTVEIGMPLGAIVVHEIVGDDGRRLKLAEPRRPGVEPRAPGTAVRLAPVAPETVSLFPAP